MATSPVVLGQKRILPAMGDNCYYELQSGSQHHSMGRFIIPLYQAINYYTERKEHEAPQYQDI
jgi:hypothetical protein